jgi:serine/threonine protein kinase
MTSPTTTTDDTMMEQRDQFRLLEKIGKGSYGTVFKAYDCRDKNNNNIIIMNNNYSNNQNNNHNDGIYNHDDGIINNNNVTSSSSSSDNNNNYYNNFVAIKIINLEDAADEIEQIHQEITIMSNISCPQLTKYYSSFITGMITNKKHHII